MSDSNPGNPSITKPYYLLSTDFSQNFPELALTAVGDTFLGTGHILAVGSRAEVFLMILGQEKKERGMIFFRLDSKKVSLIF